MIEKVVEYARVSQEEQAKGNSVSIDQQLAAMQALREDNRWANIGVFIDAENYKATKAPKKGKIVNPSGERADRPNFLKMLDVIKTGETDGVVCWRDDRLVRHPRVAVALEDALDIGDAKRPGKSKIRVFDATGAEIDRFTLSIKATIWREENKRRAERVRMGKVATLQQGGWPGSFKAYGYTTRKEPGKRGRIIGIDDEEAEWVLKIYKWFDAGLSKQKIRQRLIAQGVQQGKEQATNRKHDWAIQMIYHILKEEFYTGKLTWRFSDGTEYTIDIPPIVPNDLWERVQNRIERNKELSRRNTKYPYLLLGILFCGECSGKMQSKSIKYYYHKGKRRNRKSPARHYQCIHPERYPEEPHPRPYSRGVLGLDWQVWRIIVDNGIKKPNLIIEQVRQRQADLKTQGDSIDGDVAHARQKLTEIKSQRAFYQRQAARGKMTESEFDARMDETKETRNYWQSEIVRLKELRDNATKVEAGLDYASELLTALKSELTEIDIPPGKLRKLPEDKQREILKERQKIVRALCDRVVLYADGRVRIKGVLDGSEAAQFRLAGSKSIAWGDKRTA